MQDTLYAPISRRPVSIYTCHHPVDRDLLHWRSSEHGQVLLRRSSSILYRSSVLSILRASVWVWTGRARNTSSNCAGSGFLREMFFIPFECHWPVRSSFWHLFHNLISLPGVEAVDGQCGPDMQTSNGEHLLVFEVVWYSLVFDVLVVCGV